jgi:hypothetical protein
MLQILLINHVIVISCSITTMSFDAIRSQALEMLGFSWHIGVVETP